MPELPEVEIVMRGLEKALGGKKISEAAVNRGSLRTPIPKEFSAVLTNRKMIQFIRRGKYIVALLSGGQGFCLHLGMSGRVRIYGPQEVYDQQKHDHFALTMQDGTRAVLNDARRFGMLFLVDEKAWQSASPFDAMGPEPLDQAFDGAVLASALKGRKTPIKTALLDQRIVAGIGNIYACEALFRSSIDPRRLAGTLTTSECILLVKEVKNVLKKAIRAGGSSLRDYRNTRGEQGYFQHHFEVYDREGAPCTECNCNVLKTGGIQRIVQAGRSTFYCPRKQV